MKTTKEKHLLIEVGGLSQSILDNLFTLGSDVDKKTIVSLTYSPTTDTIYIYCKDSFSGGLLYCELKKQLTQENGVDIKTITTDIVNSMYIIELEFGNKETIIKNLEQSVTTKSIDNRYL
jgi:hypothetical protein